MPDAQQGRERSPRTGDLGKVMNAVARDLQERHGDVEGTLQAITRAAVERVPGAEECGVSYVIGRRRIEPRASTGRLPRDVDALQERLGQGPCTDAVWRQQVVRVDDVSRATQWPDFAVRAAALGAASMMCFQLFVVGDQLGALNMYACTPGAFDDDAQEVGQALAAHAAVALAGAEHEDELRKGLHNRDVIGQAKGILMERYRLTAPAAFEMLTRASSVTNRKLAEIAAELTTTGAFLGPGDAGR